jgi:hypothetical protein
MRLLHQDGHDGHHLGTDALHRACAMLSVSALEAFINSTIYFAVDAAKQRPISLPTELQANAAEYQRRTELTQKWNELGKALCIEWPPPTAVWTNFVKLVQLRMSWCTSRLRASLASFQWTIIPSCI